MCHHFWIRVDVTNSNLSNAMVSGLSVSSLMNLRLVQVLLLLQRHFDVCSTALNAFGWNSFLTRRSIFLSIAAFLCVYSTMYFCGIVLLYSQFWQWLLTNTSCLQGKFLSFLLVLGLGCALSKYGLMSWTKEFRYHPELKSLACVPTTWA